MAGASVGVVGMCRWGCARVGKEGPLGSLQDVQLHFLQVPLHLVDAALCGGGGYLEAAAAWRSFPRRTRPWLTSAARPAHVLLKRGEWACPTATVSNACDAESLQRGRVRLAAGEAHTQGESYTDQPTHRLAN